MKKINAVTWWGRKKSLIKKAWRLDLAWKVDSLSKQKTQRNHFKSKDCQICTLSLGVHKHVGAGAALQKPDVNEVLKIKPRVQVNLNPDEGDTSGAPKTEHTEDAAGSGEDSGPV